MDSLLGLGHRHGARSGWRNAHALSRSTPLAHTSFAVQSERHNNNKYEAIHETEY
jgi:hypothetical protein